MFLSSIYINCFPEKNGKMTDKRVVIKKLLIRHLQEYKIMKKNRKENQVT